MALNIKSPEADRLARALAKATGESITEAVTKALEERLDRVERRRGKSAGDILREISARTSQLPWRDDITNEEAVGYDERGIW